ncbi:uncharacterized protein EV422DRAFT_73393 [Fimicolochytrium jonesii]|uniref:uncharacterized protein n=1 Tax=Fimicolochytrium jonesii TaxID=1396493 RepID=UPI0022FDE8D8|nr:uncharacterized protein EV422DRAFT_73393 [Fimicolochytrium jonesii]KAI8820503.1 hypothetical protein EV422DRAFT_73393 [Fimicolochytrium jonesii]
MAHISIALPRQPFGADSGWIRDSTLREPDIKEVNLGSFPTPSKAPPAGQRGDIAIQSSVASDVASFKAQRAANLRNANINNVEAKLRSHVFAHRIRVADIFADFDKLRSGYISATQFRRCIGTLLQRGVSSPLAEHEIEELLDYYDVKGNRLIKYTNFVDNIDKVFGVKKLESNPTQQIPDSKEVVKPFRTLSPSSETLLQNVLQRLRTYVNWHGSDVKTWFKDFDKHNNGLITVNQFRRGVPSSLLSMEEQDLLVQLYSSDQSVNYFKLNTDVNRRGHRHHQADSARLISQQPNTDYRTHYVPVGTEELIFPARATYPPRGPSADEVEDKIKIHVYKERIRLIEFFRDYDRHNNGLVTQHQFRAGLRSASLELDHKEIEALLPPYSTSDGRVKYRAFCDSVEQVFTMKELERDPLLEVGPIPREALVQGPNKLPEEDEARCQQLLERLSKLVDERHLLLEPYFKDFDMCLGQCILGRVSRSHFRRLLSRLKLDLSNKDIHLLFAKFEDHSAPDQINYNLFLTAIDAKTYLAYSSVKATTSNVPGVPSAIDFYDSRPKDGTSPGSSRTASLEAILNSLRVHIYRHRIRVSECFRDIDKLRSYSIPRVEFARGIHRIGDPSLSPEAIERLADAYADKDKSGCCKWKLFEADIERVFGDTDLESRPSHVPTQVLNDTDPFLTSSSLTYDEESKLHGILNMIRGFLLVRQTSVKPFFKDFDKLRTGFVTKAQFRQTLSYIRCPISEDEFSILSRRYLKAAHNVAASAAQGTSPAKYLDRVAKWALGSDSLTEDYVQNTSQRICYVAFLQELEEGLPFEMREQSGRFRPNRNSNVFVPSQHDGVPTDSKWVAQLPASETEKYVTEYTRIVKPPIYKRADPDMFPVAQKSWFGFGFPLPAGETLPLTFNEVRRVMMDIKTKPQTKSERIRIRDTMSDFDPLRHHRITACEFQRSLKLLFPALEASALRALSKLYSEKQDGMVSFQRFADDVDSVFTKKGLEKDPLGEPDAFPPPGEPSSRERKAGANLTGEETNTLRNVLAKVRKVLEVRRIELLTFLEDYDKVKEGTITTNQLRSVMSNIGIHLQDDEVAVLAKKFASLPTLERLDYREFVHALANGL